LASSIFGNIFATEVTALHTNSKSPEENVMQVLDNKELGFFLCMRKFLTVLGSLSLKWSQIGHKINMLTKV